MLIFYCAGGKIGEVAGVFLAEEHSPDAGSEAPDAVCERPVCRLPGPARLRHRTLGTGRWLERLKGPNMARGGVNSLFTNSTNSLEQEVSK